MVSIIADGSGGPGFVSTSLLFFSFELLFNEQAQKERKNDSFLMFELLFNDQARS